MFSFNISTRSFRELGIAINHHLNVKLSVHNIYLLHLELDGGLEVEDLSDQVVTVGHQGGELARLDE